MSNSAVAHAPLTLTLSDNPTLNAVVPLVGRVLIAALFILSGFAKVSAPEATISYIQAAGLPFPTLGYAVAVAVELGAGLALIIGYQTRAVAAVMAAFTLAAAFAFHAHLADQNQFIHFFKNISITGGLLQVAIFGGGRFSFDGRNR